MPNTIHLYISAYTAEQLRTLATKWRVTPSSAVAHLVAEASILSEAAKKAP